MALTASMIAQLQATQTKTVGNVTPSVAVSLAKQLDFTDGTTANKADLLWQDSRLLTATTENLDLAAILTDLFGAAITFVKVRGIYIENTNLTTGAILTVGGHATLAFINWVGDATDTIKIGPGGVFLLSSPVDGYAVTAATGDMLKIDSGAATITYKIGILGTSA